MSDSFFTNSHRPMVNRQIDETVSLLKKALIEDLLGVYLYGSYFLGGLQPHSDLDFLVVVKSCMLREVKKSLIEELLNISAFPGNNERMPLDITFVKESDIKPWSFPPRFEFQYGEWLRPFFEKGDDHPFKSEKMADIAIILTQVNLQSKTLFGPSPSKWAVPFSDCKKAMMGQLEGLFEELNSDTRNVILTAARIWYTFQTKTFCSKPKAAQWALKLAPTNFHPVLQRALSICQGDEPEHWDDLKDQTVFCLEFLVSAIKETHLKC